MNADSVKGMNIQNAEVHTSDGKSAGQVIRVNDEYFTAFKKGILTDEEFNIPLGAISRIEPKGNNQLVVRLSLDEVQVKHGHEFVKGKPNSDLISGAAGSAPLIPQDKPLIRYESIRQPEDSPRAPRRERLQHDVEYRCDLCNERLGDAGILQKHRKEHNAPVGI